MIAIAIACNPKLLIADEPTTALDVTIQAQILDLIKRLQKEYNMSILMITHNLGIVTEICNRVIVMYAGRFVEISPVAKLFDNPCHPYTLGLLSSIPSLKSDKKKLYSIPGSVPHPKEFVEGCRFFSRCEKRIELCESNTPPPLFEVEQNHYVSCWLYRKKNIGTGKKMMRIKTIIIQQET